MSNISFLYFPYFFLIIYFFSYRIACTGYRQSVTQIWSPRNAIRKLTYGHWPRLSGRYSPEGFQSGEYLHPLIPTLISSKRYYALYKFYYTFYLIKDIFKFYRAFHLTWDTFTCDVYFMYRQYINGFLFVFAVRLYERRSITVLWIRIPITPACWLSKQRLQTDAAVLGREQHVEETTSGNYARYQSDLIPSV